MNHSPQLSRSHGPDRWRHFALASLSVFVLLTGSNHCTMVSADDHAWFETNVRPLLVRHCYECHSTESGSELKGGLALHSRAGWMAGGDSGAAIVPGKPEESLLIQSIRYESYEMPPKGRLPDNEVAIFEEWVRRGAPDPRDEDYKPQSKGEIDFNVAREFWAFQSPTTHHPPDVQNSAWPRDAIDFFILSELEQNGLQPANDADPAAWLRRTTFDLTGLPPTVDELDAFLAHGEEAKKVNGPARQQVVDRLLASRQFGVHWGRHWLDVARYADSNGGDFNATFYNAWRYRNYVVDAFNSDKPFDQFVREQLAGDLLPANNDQQRAEQLIASSFLMIGVKMLSERDKNKLTMDVVDEQIDTTGKAFLGMTLGCARCHDHKFDPVPTKDYYSLAGIFRSTVTLEGESQQYVSTWVETPLPVSPEEAQRIADHEQHIKEAKTRLANAKKQQQELEKKVALAGSAKGSILIDNDAAKLTGKWPSSSLAPARVGATYLRDDRENKGQKFVVWTPDIRNAGKYEVRVSYPGKGGCDERVPFTVRFSGGERRVLVDQSKPAPIDGLFCSLGTFEFAAGTTGSITLSTEGTTGFVLADAVQFIPQNLPVASDASMMQQLASLQQELEELKASISMQESALKTAEKEGPKPPMAMAAREASTIEDCEILVRGELAHPGPKVPRGFMQVVAAGPGVVQQSEESGRAELADWIARADNPLTARVIVNRVWQHMLGEGIVRSVDNFGHLGDPPSHQKLLDTLATEFVQNGWSVKQLIRRIALTRTYAMATTYDEPSFQTDPDNRLLWRANRKKLSAESLRDSLLMLSGQLDLTPGESPVADLGALAIDNSKQGGSGRKTDAVKRSLYLPIVRNELPDFLVTFDFADPDMVTGRRPETNVPAQAMYLLNNSVVREHSQKIAAQLMSSVPKDTTAPDQIICREAFKRILNRQPTETEINNISTYIDGHPDSERNNVWAEVVQTLFASTEFRMLE
ncbi:MAG: DUF1553 domain-containing protein [Planctomycetaceae bacterium]